MYTNVCKHCHKVFHSKIRTLCCKDCRAEDEDQLDDIVKYLKEYPNSNALQISEEDAREIDPHLNIGDIARVDEDELESMRVPSGEGVIMRPAVDARYVAKVPVNEVSEGLRYLLDHLEDEDDGEDDEE